MTYPRNVAWFALAVLLAASPARADVHITFANGRVTLDARNASLREILTQWSSVGQTQILNVDKLSAAPLTLRLDNVPERQALDTLLRSLPGYVVAGQRDAGPSTYARIVILAVSNTAPAPRPQPPAVTERRARRSDAPPGFQLIPPELMPVPLGDPRKELPADPDAEEETPEESPQPAPTSSPTPGVIIPARK